MWLSGHGEPHQVSILNFKIICCAIIWIVQLKIKAVFAVSELCLGGKAQNLLLIIDFSEHLQS
jgi:hypothetical protein